MIYNSADLSRVDKSEGTEFRRKHSIPEDRTLVAQVSWIIPEKGIGDLLAAARLAVSQNPKIHFVFVGEGAHRERYTLEAIQMGLEGNVTWTGQVEDPMADGVFAAADVVCQVSRWEEVFGYVIAEAMSCGRPLVATRVGGIPELVEDEKTGFVLDRGDVRGIADRILMLASDRELRERMGRAGREVAADKFDLERNVGRVVESYGVGAPAESRVITESLATAV